MLGNNENRSELSQELSNTQGGGSSTELLPMSVERTGQIAHTSWLTRLSSFIPHRGPSTNTKFYSTLACLGFTALASVIAVRNTQTTIETPIFTDDSPVSHNNATYAFILTPPCGFVPIAGNITASDITEVISRNKDIFGRAENTDRKSITVDGSSEPLANINVTCIDRHWNSNIGLRRPAQYEIQILNAKLARDMIKSMTLPKQGTFTFEIVQRPDCKDSGVVIRFYDKGKDLKLGHNEKIIAKDGILLPGTARALCDANPKEQGRLLRGGKV